MKFSTVDLHLAAYLKLQGYSVFDITVQDRKGSFHFNDIPDDVVQQFLLEQTLVEPQAYMSAVRNLTTAVRHVISTFNDKGRGGNV